MPCARIVRSRIASSTATWPKRSKPESSRPMNSRAGGSTSSRPKRLASFTSGSSGSSSVAGNLEPSMVRRRSVTDMKRLGHRAGPHRDAERWAEAIDAGFSGRQPLAEALADYEQQRNAAVMPMYEFTLQLANLAAPPSPAMQQLFAALCGNQAETSHFFGTLAGTVPIHEFFASANVQQIIRAR